MMLRMMAQTTHLQCKAKATCVTVLAAIRLFCSFNLAGDHHSAITLPLVCQLSTFSVQNYCCFFPFLSYMA